MPVETNDVDIGNKKIDDRKVDDKLLAIEVDLILISACRR